jgi:hypothetical protein
MVFSSSRRLIGLGEQHQRIYPDFDQQTVQHNPIGTHGKLAISFPARLIAGS